MAGEPIVPLAAELTAQEGAELLNVLHSYLLVGRLDEGRIQVHRGGTHRRVPFKDAMTYRAEHHRLRGLVRGFSGSATRQAAGGYSQSLRLLPGAMAASNDGRSENRSEVKRALINQALVKLDGMCR